MQLFEHDCPACNRRLRMRGPMRDRQAFDCPDCSTALVVRLNGGLCELLLDEQAAVSGPANKGLSSTPRVVAWTTAGILVVGFLAFLLAGPDTEASTDPEAQAAIATGEPDAAEPGKGTSDTPLSEQPAEPQSPEPLDELQDESLVAAIDSTEHSEPETNAAEPLIPSAADPVEPEPDPAELERQREQERIAAEAAAKAEAERTAIAAIEQKLNLPLSAYASRDDMTLTEFFDEFSSLSGTPIHTAQPPKTVVSVALKECTLKVVFDEVIRETNLSYELRPDGIHVFAR